MDTEQHNWTEKHRPTKWSDIQGNNSAIADIRDWLDGWQPGEAPQLLIGEPGTGKTTTARVAARELDMEFHEVDTSTARKSDDIKRFVGEMRGGDKVVLLDEVDSWPGRVKLDPLSEELKDPSNPVFLTANSEYDVPTSIKSPCDTHEFKLNKSSRRAKIKDIAKKEGVPLDEKDLARLVERPDLRSAINDLQIHARMGVPIGEDQRSWDESEFSAMDSIIQYEDADDVDVRPPWLVMWLDQNVRKEYRGLELAAAYDALSRADVYLGNAEPGDYRPWRYAGALAEEVANLRLTEPYTGWVSWDFPSWVQSKVPKATDDTPEAELFRRLKRLQVVTRDNKKRLDDTEPGFYMTGSYVEFREEVLPLLKRLPPAERLQFAVDARVGENAASALDVDAGDYADATVNAAPTRGEELDAPTDDAMESDW